MTLKLNHEYINYIHVIWGKEAEAEVSDYLMFYLTILGQVDIMELYRMMDFIIHIDTILSIKK